MYFNLAKSARSIWTMCGKKSVLKIAKFHENMKLHNNCNNITQQPIEALGLGLIAKKELVCLMDISLIEIEY